MNEKPVKPATQERRDRLLTIIQSRPGIGRDSLDTIQGTSRDTTQGDLISLWERGLIRLGCDRFAPKSHPVWKTWPIEIEPGIQDMQLFRPSHRQEPPIRTYFDPSVVGTQQPRPYSIDELPTASQWKPSPIHPISHNPMTDTENKRQAHRSEAEMRAALEDAITELLAANRPFALKDVARKARVSLDALYQTRFMDIKNKAMEAIASAKNNREPDPTYSALTGELEMLRQQNHELRQQMERLKAQSDPRAITRETLEGEIEALKQTLRRLEGEERQLEDDKRSAIVQLHGLQQALMRLGGEVEPLRLEMVPISNGNGNGNHAIGGRS